MSEQPASKQKLSFTNERDNHIAKERFYDENVVGSIVDDEGFILARIWADYTNGPKVVQQLISDAERYRKLRQKILDGDPFDVSEAYIKLKVVGNYPNAEDFDAAVDQIKESP